VFLVKDVDILSCLQISLKSNCGFFKPSCPSALAPAPHFHALFDAMQGDNNPSENQIFCANFLLAHFLQLTNQSIQTCTKNYRIG